MAKVTCTLHGAVRTVLLDRPEKRNALDPEMMTAIQAHFARPPAEEERVAVIRAAGPVFCAGVDLKQRFEHPQKSTPIEQMLHAIEHFALPVVAVVQGDAIAGGTRKMLLLGDPLPARRLYDLGVISHIAEPEDLHARAQEVIQRLADNAPLSLRAMKALIVREMAFRDRIAHADVDRLVADVRRSQDAQEGIAARLARRKPSFKGL